jgi:cytochrome c oxidase subunit 4
MSREHVTRPPAYFAVFVALLVLMGATLGAAAIDFGRWNLVIALSIAGIKTVLIVLFFMHLLHSISLVKFVACAGIVWAAIGAAFTLADYFTRGWKTPTEQVYLPRADDRASPGHEVVPPAATYPPLSADGDERETDE